VHGVLRLKLWRPKRRRRPGHQRKDSCEGPQRVHEGAAVANPFKNPTSDDQSTPLSRRLASSGVVAIPMVRIAARDAFSQGISWELLADELRTANWYRARRAHSLKPGRGSRVLYVACATQGLDCPAEADGLTAKKASLPEVRTLRLHREPTGVANGLACADLKQ